jgi:hypothetical protein
MYVVVTGFHARASIVLALCALPSAACGGGGGEAVISVGERHDAGMDGTDGTHAIDMDDADRPCDMVQVDGELVVERERDFTARFRMGEPYTKTIMLFGGEPIEDANVLGNAYIIGLDKTDAQMLAERYPDFYLCSSPGGQAAAEQIVPYDFVPATCQVYDQIIAALRQFNTNVAAGADRTSIRFDGAPLQLESVTADATGEDVTDQVSDQDFHLVTSVEQLTGESVLSFGTSD